MNGYRAGYFYELNTLFYDFDFREERKEMQPALYGLATTTKTTTAGLNILHLTNVLFFLRLVNCRT